MGAFCGRRGINFAVARNISRSNEHKITFKKLSKWKGFGVVRMKAVLGGVEDSKRIASRKAW